MGASHSSIPPHPLEIIVPNGKVLVPQYTPFTVHPPPPRRPRRVGRVPRRRRRILPDYEFVGGSGDEENDSESEFEMMNGMEMGMGIGMGSGFRGGRGGRRGMGMGMGMGMGRFGGLGMEEDRPRSAPVGGMGGGYGGMMPSGIGGEMGGMGGMGGPGMGGMGPPGSMMGGGGPGGMMGAMGPGGGMGHGGQPPPGYSSMPHMPPRYGGGAGIPPGGPNPYNYQTSPRSSSSSASTRPEQRTPRRTSGAKEHIPMSAYAKSVAQSPKIKRSHTEPSTADRLNRKVGPSGKEWIKGDDFLDACMCTTNCTCREGHRVLYRSRDDPCGDSNGEARYGAGEIRYILKKDLGRDCGDHSGCRPKADSDNEAKMSKKEKKKEEKKRKEQFEGFKEDMLEALDERFDALKKDRASKAGSVRSSPRQAFAGLGAPPFGMGGQIPNALDPRMAQQFGGGGRMGMGMGGNSYAMGMQGGMNTMPGMGGVPMSGGRPMRPHQLAGMAFDGEMAMDDMGVMGVENPYSGPGMGGRGMPPVFRSPGGRRDLGGMNFDHMAALYGRRVGMIDRRERGKPPRGRGGQRPVNFDVGSDDSDLSPHQRGGRQGKVERKTIFDNMTGKLARNTL
jgi:hypothetical protein